MIQKKLPITIVIPVKNEEQNLPRCLARLAQFQKIVVVDSGSNDKTKIIAENHGCDFYNFEWNGHFPKKRNWFLLNHPPVTPWVFFLDADEYVPIEFLRELELVLPITTHVGFRVGYINYFLGNELRHGVPQIKLPLFRVNSGLYERIDEDHWSKLDMEVHEHPILNGTIGTLISKIDHQDYKGRDAFIRRHDDYSTWEARRYLKLRHDSGAMKYFTPSQRRKYNTLSNWWLGPSYFFYSWIWKRGFLDGWSGLVIALMKSKYFMNIRSKIINFSKSSNKS